MKILNLVGEPFGRWLVIRRAGYIGNRVSWLCHCECGNESIVTTSNLRSGKSRSCGCLHIDTITTHSASLSVEYRTWQSIQQRCYNQNHIQYAAYGGRGIYVCTRWLASFEKFFADMGNRPSNDHSIERLDVNGPYAPYNCTWATFSEQQNNRRTSRYLTFNGKTQTVARWARELNISKTGLLYRLNAGWPVAEALTKPRDRTRLNTFG